MKKSTKKPVKTPKEYHYYLPYTEYTYGGEICAGQENDDWPSYEDTDIELSVDNYLYKEMNEGDYAEKFTLNRPIKIGYVVLVRYSTGSTFGRTNGAFYFEGLYRTRKAADAVLKTIDNDTYSKYCPWKGYFEALESAEVLELEVRDKQPYKVRRY